MGRAAWAGVTGHGCCLGLVSLGAAAAGCLPPASLTPPALLCAACSMAADTDRLKAEAMRKLKGEAEGEGQRRKVAVRWLAACQGPDFPLLAWPVMPLPACSPTHPPAAASPACSPPLTARRRAPLRWGSSAATCARRRRASAQTRCACCSAAPELWAPHCRCCRCRLSPCRPGPVPAALLPQVIGRQKEVLRITQILARKKKNNPILLGEPGVGKTAIAEGLARAIVTRTNADGSALPAFLAGKRVMQLDVGLLIAGAKVGQVVGQAWRRSADSAATDGLSCCGDAGAGRGVDWVKLAVPSPTPGRPRLPPGCLQERGELELRVTKLLQECKSEGNIILMIDEVRREGGEPSGAAYAWPNPAWQCGRAWCRCPRATRGYSGWLGAAQPHHPWPALLPAGAHACGRGRGGARRRRRRRPRHLQPPQARAGPRRAAVHRRYHPGRAPQAH